MPKLTSNETPLNPYRVLWDLAHTVDVANTIITHDAGSPRDQLSPFWRSTEPLTYLGWGKTTQLGYGLGLAMGAKLAHPDKLCINVWGDAAIGFTGMDFETAVRERIPIMSVLLNNFSMAIELKVMPISTKKYRSTDISGDYAAMARAFGGYGERVTAPEEIVPAILRGIAQTQAGVPVLLEFLTCKETRRRAAVRRAGYSFLCQRRHVAAVPGRAHHDLVDHHPLRQAGDVADQVAEVLGLRHPGALLGTHRHRALVEQRRRHLARAAPPCSGCR